MASKTIARRKTTEEEVAPQSQILYGMSLNTSVEFKELMNSPRRRNDINSSSCQTSSIQASSIGFGTISTERSTYRWFEPSCFPVCPLSPLFPPSCHLLSTRTGTGANNRSVRNEIINKPLARGVLDGHLLAQFAQQPIKRQKEMMRQIGSSSTTVFSDLHSLSGFW